ncbi:unnamed protein product [Hyaloperonospora brassicae]|uniref:CDT1 Geminin-binding domain-containing protein n=1 Tax=Hyaloperonospora brassicae TaxID=162125 RepID=A0AAV0UB74_HYABA|nr:unnamed protein product [Hyaloperonospora brassicae]
MADATPDAPAPPRAPRRLDDRAPPALRLLLRLFSSLEFGLGALTLYQHTPDFAAVQRAVESSSHIRFTRAHLQQMLSLLPGAYDLKWKRNTGDDQRRELRPVVLTLRKQRLPPPHADCEGLAARIALFVDRANAFVDERVSAIQKEFPAMTNEEVRHALTAAEIERAPLPDLPTEAVHEELSGRTQVALHGDKKEQLNGATCSESDAKLAHELAKPVPQDLQSLPQWLVDKVREKEMGRKAGVEQEAKSLQKRLLVTLPQLSDQLQSLVMVTRKSSFAKQFVLRRLAARAPIKGRVEDQLYLLESLVPEWLTVVLVDGNEYIKISTSCKYNTIKASLRRAISIQV